MQCVCALEALTTSFNSRQIFLSPFTREVPEVQKLNALLKKWLGCKCTLDAHVKQNTGAFLFSFLSNILFLPQGIAFIVSPLDCKFSKLVFKFSLKEMTSKESPRASVSTLMSTSGGQTSASAAEAGCWQEGAGTFVYCPTKASCLSFSAMLRCMEMRGI